MTDKAARRLGRAGGCAEIVQTSMVSQGTPMGLGPCTQRELPGKAARAAVGKETR